MDISLTPDLEEFVQTKIATDHYPTASDVVVKALQVFREQDEERRLRVEQLRQEIRVGIAQLDDGQAVVLDDEAIAGIKQRGRERLAALDGEARAR